LHDIETKPGLAKLINRRLVLLCPIVRRRVWGPLMREPHELPGSRLTDGRTGAVGVEVGVEPTEQHIGEPDRAVLDRLFCRGEYRRLVLSPVRQMKRHLSVAELIKDGRDAAIDAARLVDVAARPPGPRAASRPVAC
jgi:hypothetical protein